MNPIRLKEPEYEGIEETISTTAMGRAFLREHSKRARMVAVAEVREMLAAKADADDLKRMQENQGSPMDMIRQDLTSIAVAISRARQEVQALTEESDEGNRFTLAAGELSAIVDATEQATSEILNATEAIGELADKIESDLGANAPADAINAIQEHVTNIFMACSFQDITGQRVTRVVDVVGFIERRILGLLQIWDEGETAGNPDYVIEDPVDQRPDAFLCNGPQLDAPDQDEIDALFAAAPAPGEAPVAEAPAPAPAAPAVQAAAPAGPASQDDIDAMFDAPAPAAEVAPAPAAPAPAPQAAVPAGPASQDDIDAMFDAPAPATEVAPAPATPAPQAAAPSGPASQDDINAMFDAPAPAAEVAPAPAPAAPAAQAAAPSGPASQDDIDAMFDTPAPAAEVAPAPAAPAPQPAAAQPAAAAAQPAAPAPAPAPKAEVKPAAPSGDGGGAISQDDIDALFG